MEQPRKVIWLSTIVIAVFHIGAIAALFMFSWRAFAAMLVLYWVAGCLGVCIGYHRLHTHRSYRVPKALDYFLATCGSLTFEGGPISWVPLTFHRIHHQKSDQPGDPHSPREGAWWAHIGWIVLGDANHNNTRIMSKYAPDLAKSIATMSG